MDRHRALDDDVDLYLGILCHSSCDMGYRLISANANGRVCLDPLCWADRLQCFFNGDGRAPGLVLAVPNYVKKVVFPLEILPVVITGSVLITALINVVLLLAGSILVYHAISPTIWLLPVVFVPLIFLTLGSAWFLASLVFLSGILVRQ